MSNASNNISNNINHGLSRGASRLTINLEAIAHNYRLVQDRVGGACQIGPAVKADAYGLGAEKIVPILDSLDCPFYFVATLDEAIRLRNITDRTIFMLGGFVKDCALEYMHYRVIPVLNSLYDIESWRALSVQKETSLNAIIHVDTGMNRLGLGKDETTILLAEKETLLEGINILYFMSHFASADDVESPLTRQQYERFAVLRDHFPYANFSLANSSGVFRSEDYHMDMVRPGMCLYGLNPTPETGNPMKPVVSLRTRVVQTRNVQAGETVGYGATYKFEQDTVVATVALGYADGFFRHLSSDGRNTVVHLFYDGQPCPVIGRVSMDLVTVDVGHLARKPHPDDMMEVIGKNRSADDLATAAGTIGYEVLTSLGSRYARDYLGEIDLGE